MIKLKKLTKYFGRVKAVDSLEIEIAEGEIFTLLGPSGCGKTTTLRSIAGLESPDEGEITLGGRTVVSITEGIFVPPHKRNVGMVFQSYAIWPHMTVFENVAYPLKVRRFRSSKIRESVMNALGLVGLTGLEDRLGPQLSGGQQQRVALARALVHEPSVLLLDEPFSNLDAKLREQMRFQLKLLLNKIKITVVFVTHDQIEALSLSDRTAVMEAGHIEQLGPPRELYERPRTPFVRDFLGRTVLFRGTVTSILRNGRISVSVNGSAKLKLIASSPEHTEREVGRKVIIAVRPEDIDTVTGDTRVPNCNYLPARVQTQLFVGDHCECRVGLESGESFVIYTPRSVAWREGEAIGLGIAEERISIWPA